MIKIAVIGTGISGATIALRLKQLLRTSGINYKLYTFDQGDQPGGACRDQPITEIDGLLDVFSSCSETRVHLYGPHIFHTNSYRVWDFLRGACNTKWMPFNLKVKALIDGNIVPLPVSFSTVQKCFPAYTASMIEQEILNIAEYNSKIYLSDLLASKNKYVHMLGQFIKDKVFKNYTAKQWDISIDEIDQSIINRVPFVASMQESYFTDKYQMLPRNGYTSAISEMVNASKSIHQSCVRVSYQSLCEQGFFDDSDDSIVVCTAPIDEFFDYCLDHSPKYGNLSYRTCDFRQVFTKAKHHRNGEHVINYPNNYDYTRSVDYCNWFNPKASLENSHSLTVYEYPSAWDPSCVSPRLYPVRSDADIALYDEYVKYADSLPTPIIFAGRLGLYKYLNMDTAVDLALDTAQSVVDYIHNRTQRR